LRSNHHLLQSISFSRHIWGPALDLFSIAFWQLSREPGTFYLSIWAAWPTWPSWTAALIFNCWALGSTLHWITLLILISLYGLLSCSAYLSLTLLSNLCHLCAHITSPCPHTWGHLFMIHTFCHSISFWRLKINHRRPSRISSISDMETCW